MADEIREPLPDRPPEPPLYEGDFEIFYLGGQKRYRCNQYWSTGHRCWYDTYDKAELLRHISQPHSETGKRFKPKQQLPVRVVSPVLGPDGRPVVYDGLANARFREEEEDEGE